MREGRLHMEEIVRFVDELDSVTWPEHAVFIADGNLPDAILAHLPEPTIAVEAGEGLKRLARIEQLAEEVLAMRSSRPLHIVAVGGGSIGDAVGFLASTLWRGVGLWHIPTTLLAMVDSAHGGKTAVNLGAAKNQLGTFYEAERVIISSQVLAELPFPQREEGLAECIKGLWLGDADGLALCDKHISAYVGAPFDEVRAPLLEALRRAIAVKYDVVARDPEETKGIRTFLNFGHTVAHALELEFGIAHGLAVAWGMMCAARISGTHGSLGEEQAERLRGHVRPLLLPVTGLEAQLTFERFEALLRRDKKRVASTLRSVVLDGPGQPRVTREVTARDWFDALRAEHADFVARPIRVDWRQARHVEVCVEASKSELNRAQVIAHLRPGPTDVTGDSGADDVVYLRRALAALRRDEARIFAGLGGTTFRFLCAVAAVHHEPVWIAAEPRLLQRPHEPLFDALRAMGAQVEPREDGVEITPVDSAQLNSLPPVSVRCDRSSQFASALVMLAARGSTVTVDLQTDADGGYDADAVASRPYLEMTLRMLREAGVDVTWEGARVVADGHNAAARTAHLVAHPDESSAAVWRAAQCLGLSVDLTGLPETSEQADRALVEMLGQLTEHNDTQPLTLDLHDAPDLAPVFAATASQMQGAVHLVGAEHLRHKESNRIDDLCAACAQVGVQATPREDGLSLPDEIQKPQADAHWPTFGDHRLAMAGVLLAIRHAQNTAIVIDDPWVVTKSYPTFWRHVRQAGGLREG